MIYGIGTDIVRVQRLRDLHGRYGERLARRILGPDELLEFRRRGARGEAGPARALRYLATRFAAKEALSKALGLGLRQPMTLLSVEFLNNPRGQPVARPRKALAQYMDGLGLRAHVSLSDEHDTVVAFVVIEQAPR